MRITPAHIIIAAKQIASDAPDFTPEILAQAYRNLGVEVEPSQAAKPNTKAA